MARTPYISPQEQQLQQLLELAQFAHIASQPGVEQQQLEQQGQHQRVAAAIQLLGLQQEAKNQAEQRRLQEMGITEVAKGNVTDALLTHLAQRGDVPLSVLAKIAEKGPTGLSEGLQTEQQKVVDRQIAAHLMGYNASKDKSAFLTALQADPGMTPEVMEKLKSHLPQDAEGPDAPKSSLGTKLGTAARASYLYNPIPVPFGMAYAAGKTGERLASSSGVQDFWNALINKKPKPTQ